MAVSRGLSVADPASLLPERQRLWDVVLTEGFPHAGPALCDVFTRRSPAKHLLLFLKLSSRQQISDRLLGKRAACSLGAIVSACLQPWAIFVQNN